MARIRTVILAPPVLDVVLAVLLVIGVILAVAAVPLWAFVPTGELMAFIHGILIAGFLNIWYLTTQQRGRHLSSEDAPGVPIWPVVVFWGRLITPPESVVRRLGDVRGVHGGDPKCFPTSHQLDSMPYTRIRRGDRDEDHGLSNPRSRGLGNRWEDDVDCQVCQKLKSLYPS